MEGDGKALQVHTTSSSFNGCMLCGAEKSKKKLAHFLYIGLTITWKYKIQDLYLNQFILKLYDGNLHSYPSIKILNFWDSTHKPKNIKRQLAFFFLPSV